MEVVIDVGVATSCSSVWDWQEGAVGSIARFDGET